MLTGISFRRNSQHHLTATILITVALASIALGPKPASATNGAQFIGFSAESTALGGAGSVAVADTSAINTNPAALSLITGSRFDFTPQYIQPLLHHQDMFGNDRDGQNDPFALGNLGFATRLASVPRLTIGAGVFLQGGFASDQPLLNTAFGTVDDASSFLRYFKFSVAASYEVIPDKVTIGIAPYLGYSDVSLRLFPATSVAPSMAVPNGFFGLDIRDRCARNGGFGGLGDTCPSDVVFGVKVGAMYKVSKWLTVGASYTSPVSFNYTGGEATVNFSALGLGRVNYDAQVAGFKWPQQVDVSFAAKPTEQLLVALTTSWINWATINTVRVTASNPSNALAPPEVNLDIPFNWKDQVVVAFGLAYTAISDEAIKDRLVLRFGYNFSNNQIPDEKLSPVAPLIIQHHLSGGFGLRLTERWSFDSGVIYGLKNTVTYTNPSLPFGSNATESTSGYIVSGTLSYRF